MNRKFLYAAFSIACLAVACKEEITPETVEPVVPDWKITATIESTKVSFDDDGTNLNLSWEVGDGLVGWDEDGNVLEFEIKKASDISIEGRATFTLVHGVKTAAGKTIHLIYAPGKHWSDISSQTLVCDISSQTQDALPALMTSSAVVSDTEPFLSFQNRLAIIGLENPKVPDAGGKTINSISLEGTNVYTRATFSMSGTSLAMTPSQIGKITAQCEIPIMRDGTTQNTIVYIAVIPNSTAADLSFRTVIPAGYKNVKAARSLAAGRYYAMRPSFKAPSSEGTPSPIIMSSNVRYYGGTEKGDDTGDRAWEQRRTGYYAMINSLQPAVVGLQEAYIDPQVSDIISNCPGYAFIGRGRKGTLIEDKSSESTAILYKTSEVTINDSGTRWMSSTPDVPGSSFDDSSIRTVTWAKITLKSSGKQYFHVNMHTSLNATLQAKEMTVVLNTITSKNTGNLPVILTGDWNLEEDNTILSPITSIYQSARKTAAQTDGRITFSPWYNTNNNQHLDHIFYSGFNRCLQFSRVPDVWSGYSISDHYPVYAVFDLSSASSSDPITVDFTCPSSATMDEIVHLTDNSSSTSGIDKWKWSVGGSIYTETNPDVKFKTFGTAVPVTLTVTDGSNRTASLTKYVNVTKSEGHDLTIAWSQEYDADGYVYWTSPATNAAGNRIYVSSTGYNLVCFDNTGTQRGSFDIGIYDPTVTSDPKHQSPTPSVDDLGNVYIPVQYRYASTGNGGLFAIAPECASLLWYQPTGPVSQYEYTIPAIIGENVGLLLRGSNLSSNCLLYNRRTGNLIQTLPCDKGSIGGMAISPAGQIVYGTNRGSSTEAGAGYKVAIPNSDFSSWSSSSASDVGRAFNLLSGTDAEGYGYHPKGGQPAISNIDGSAYVCVTSQGNSVVCARYNLNGYSPSRVPTLIWKKEFDATYAQNGHGMVLDDQGNAFLQTGDRVLCLNASNGEVVWEYKTYTGNCGVPAVDNDGYVYVCDFHGGKLLKLSPSDGSEISSITVNIPRSCPTIAPDGSIYVTGNNDVSSRAVLYKITCAKTTGPGSNWSQLGCNPQKTCSFSGYQGNGTRNNYNYDNLFD